VAIVLIETSSRRLRKTRWESNKIADVTNKIILEAKIIIKINNLKPPCLYFLINKRQLWLYLDKHPRLRSTIRYREQAKCLWFLKQKTACFSWQMNALLRIRGGMSLIYLLKQVRIEIHTMQDGACLQESLFARLQGLANK
jgi:hypothetical protein